MTKFEKGDPVLVERQDGTFWGIVMSPNLYDRNVIVKIVAVPEGQPGVAAQWAEYIGVDVWCYTYELTAA